MALLSFLTFFPVMGVVVILLFKRFREDVSDTTIKRLAVGTTVITFIISLIVLLGYDRTEGGMQMYAPMDWIPSWGIHYALGIDGLSILMVLLTTFITMLAVSGSWDDISKQVSQYYIFMLFLETGMIGVFLAQDMFLFYVFWEFTLVPMYFLVGIWGGKDRVYAAIKFFLYTMAGSLLMLLAILYMGIQNNTFLLQELIAGRDVFAAAQNVLFFRLRYCLCHQSSHFPLPLLAARCSYRGPYGRFCDFGGGTLENWERMALFALIYPCFLRLLWSLPQPLACWPLLALFMGPLWPLPRQILKSW